MGDTMSWLPIDFEEAGLCVTAVMEICFLQQTAGGTTFSGINRPRLRSPGNSGAAGRGCRLYSHINTVPDNDPDFSNTRSWLNSKLLETLQVRDSIWFISLLL